MSAVVRILPSGREFVVEANESLLDAALRSGMGLEFGCVNGSCGKCKGRIKEGEVRQVRFHDYAMREAEKLEHTVLLCSCTADSDVTIEAAEASGPDDISVQSVRARLYKQERVAQQVEIVHLRVMRGKVLRFIAGQHARLQLAGVESIELPIASCPCDGLNLEFHFDRRNDGELVARAFEGFQKSDRFEIEGPIGRFTLDESSARPMVFIASESAIAPSKSIIEHAINLELPQPIFLYWSAARPDGHYLHNYFRSLTDALDEFFYVPISEPINADTLNGLPDPATIDVYLSGETGFIDSTTKLLYRCGLPENRLFIDALYPRPRPAPTAD